MLTYASNLIKVQASQILYEKTTRSAVDGFREFILVTMSPAFENSHTLATDVARIQRYVCAAAGTPGNLFAC